MQTNLADFVKNRPDCKEAESILRACVHCGFCTATCPTYQLLGNELDGPRGRIYLMKQMLEGAEVTKVTQQHLDRCLTCQACETICPSGVRYGRLLDIGREIVDEKVGRTLKDQMTRWCMRSLLPYRDRFSRFLQLGRLIKPVLPLRLRRKIPKKEPPQAWPRLRHQRRMLIFPGCVQSALAPNIDAAAANVLDQLGISLLRLENAGCCGALNYHLSDQTRALAFARSNIDACWPLIEEGAEAILSTASGCGVMIKDYGELLQDDPGYSGKAAKVSAMTRDISEILQDEDLSVLIRGQRKKIAFQSPCTLQHGQKLPGRVETILLKLGFELTPVENAHLCCGSAGVYSLLQPEISSRLLRNKLESLQGHGAELIATANIGCLMHLQTSSELKVVHWIELL